MKLRTKKRRPRGHECSILLRFVPADVRAQFKAWCSRRDISMTEAIIEFMRWMFDRDNDRPGRELMERIRKRERGRTP